MRLLIDECLPRALKRHLVGHACRTVQEREWAGKTNGVLLSLAEGRFDVFVTIDRGLEYQRNLEDRRIAMLVLSARSNQIEDLALLVPAILDALRGAGPGSVIRVGDF